MTEDELVRKLQELPRDETPPGEVRARVTAFAAPRHVASARGVLVRQLAVAASIAVVAFGAGRWTAPASTPHGATRTYALLLYGGAPDAVPDDRVQEYAAWAASVRKQGRSITGQRLEDDTWAAGADAGALAPVRGFFIVTARDDADALALAQAHPHTRYGGTVVVRPVAP